MQPSSSKVTSRPQNQSPQALSRWPSTLIRSAWSVVLPRWLDTVTSPHRRCSRSSRFLEEHRSTGRGRHRSEELIEGTIRTDRSTQSTAETGRWPEREPSRQGRWCEAPYLSAAGRSPSPPPLHCSVAARKRQEVLRTTVIILTAPRHANVVRDEAGCPVPSLSRQPPCGFGRRACRRWCGRAP